MEAMIRAQCKVCKVTHIIQVPSLEIIKFFSGIEEAFDDLNFELQFLLATSVCWDCWEKLHE